MKKLLYILLAVVMLAGCGKSSATLDASDASEVWAEASEQASEKPLFVIDGGHGFQDSGCISDYLLYTEAEITLDMAKTLKTELEALGARVILTHDGNTFPSVDEIKELCTQNGAECPESKMKDDNIFTAYERAIYTRALSKALRIDMFVSVHVNTFPADERVDRYELYYSKENPYSSKLASFCKSFSAKLDNTVKTVASDYGDAFVVTKFGDYPSLLIETGFASNKQAADRLNSKEWREKFCKTLANEMMNTFGQ